jgi:hypothetical protein
MNGVANGLYGGDLPNQINTPWIDFSEQSTIVGWGSFTTKRIRYKVVGNIVYLMYTIDGTSNSATTSFTLPIIAKFANIIFMTYGADNGAFQIALGTSSGSTSSLLFQRYTAINSATATWTASGNKQIVGQFFYEI